jgi:hypothetical protein
MIIPASFDFGFQRFHGSNQSFLIVNRKHDGAPQEVHSPLQIGDGEPAGRHESSS